MSRYCSVDECTRPVHAKSICFTHYMRVRRHGDPSVSLINRDHPATCTIDGCGRKYRANGLCFMHWQRSRVNGDAGQAAPFKVSYPVDAQCRVADCQRRPQRHWLCEMHADRLDDRGELGPAGPVKGSVGSGYRRDDGYLEVRCVEDHPLSRGGRTLNHRLVLWDHIGEGPHSCRWCNAPVDWSFGVDDGALVVDHVDYDRTNDDPSNLAPSCHPCNSTRHRP